jgi:hypothetical protein
VGYGEVIQFRWGTKSGGGWHFSGERVGGTLFSAWEKENIEILGNFGHLRAQEVPNFRNLVNFLPIPVDFLLIQRLFFKCRKWGATHLAERVLPP